MHIAELQEKVREKSYKLKFRRQYIDLKQGYCRKMALPALPLVLFGLGYVTVHILILQERDTIGQKL